MSITELKRLLRYKRAGNIFAFFAVLFLVGCAHITVGTQLDKNKTDQIVKGKTSKEEIGKMFGEPTEKTTEAGLERWIYVNRITSASPRPDWLGVSYQGDTKEKTLAIIFEQDTVKDFSLSETSKPFVSSLGLH